VESGAVAQAIGNLGKSLQWKGPATVSELNAGITGIQPGWTYTLTDAGTLTDGSITVDVGDEVAWTEDGEWFKVMDYAPRQYGTNEVHNLATSITSFRIGDVIPVDGPSGTAKMTKDSLLQVTAQKAKEVIQPTNREVVLNYIFAGNATNPSDLNDLKSNAIYLVQRTAATTTSNFPSDFGNSEGVSILEITTAKYSSAVADYLVVQKLTIVESGVFWTRRWSHANNTWTSWVKTDNTIPITRITIGLGGDYSTLRAGIAEAIKHRGCIVDVLPGTYDLEVELADVLPNVYNEVLSGIKLDNDVHVRFHDGSKVIANFTSGNYTQEQLDKIAIYFQPLYANSGSFILENLNIEATNTRYCVHDENAGNGNYFRKYLNCKMVYHNTLQNSNARFHAIGGGLGRHGTIVIDGGSYKVTTNYGNPQVNDSTGENSQMCILYHNGNNAGCESSIVIKNVYFEDRGYAKIGWWGPSTIKSRVFVDGNSFGLPLLHIGTRYDAQADNFDVTEWNNEQRIQNVEWQINPNGYEATLVTT
jgi:hypothetical protein